MVEKEIVDQAKEITKQIEENEEDVPLNDPFAGNEGTSSSNANVSQEELQDKLSDLITNAVEIQNIVSDDSALEFDEAELESELEELSKDTRYWPDVRLSTSDHEDSVYIDPSVPLIAPPVPVSPHRQLAALA